MNSGKIGEDAVVIYLENDGYEILERNFHSRWGEIDIIAKKEKCIVFVEVKLRKSEKFAQAAEFVDYHKQNRLRTTASMYLAQHPTKLQPRFDVIEIYAPDGYDTENPLINHLEGAFE